MGGVQSRARQAAAAERAAEEPDGAEAAVEGVTGGLSRPVPIAAAHDVAGFSCGNDALDDWLKTTALKAEGRSARAYVVCERSAVVGYYCPRHRLGRAQRRARRRPPERARPRSGDDRRPARSPPRAARGRGSAAACYATPCSACCRRRKSSAVRACLSMPSTMPLPTSTPRHGFVEFPAATRTMFMVVETLRRAL